MKKSLILIILLFIFCAGVGVKAQVLEPEFVNEVETETQEVTRTLVASTGLVLTVPITTFLASYIYASKNPIYERFKE